MIAVEAPATLNYHNRQGAITTRKSNTQQRNERIQKRFNELYNVDRLRYDDVINNLCAEFSLSKGTIEKTMKS
jgi:cytidylate kinase